MGPTARTVIYTARVVHTLDPRVVSAPAVAVCDGRVVAVGAVDQLLGLDSGCVVDDRFAASVLLPGFVEAHSHQLAGALWAFPYVGFFPRVDPDGHRWDGCRSIDEVVARLREVDAGLAPGDPLLAWGLDPIYFTGERLVAEHLDRVSASRQIFVVHASLHLATVNTALMNAAEIGPDTLMEGVPKDGAGQPIGELQELPAMMLAGDVGLRLLAQASSNEATRRFGRLASRVGITTLTDLGSTTLGNDRIVDGLRAVVDDPGFPARMSVFFNPGMFAGDLAAGVDRLAVLKALTSDKLRFGQVKLVLDGSIQGFTARLRPPGYLGGQPNGIWLVPPEQVVHQVRAFHEAGAIVHAHCNGDETVDVFLDAVDEVLAGSPRADHRHTVQHCQLTTFEQYERMARLGMCANLFANHTYYWGDQHVAYTVGPERAARMNAARTVLDLGIPLSIHSDAAVTPLDSLHVAWAAVNRRTASGALLGPEQRITVAEAMRAITVGAAFQLGLDDEIGTITPGKRADFAVLGADPFQVDPAELKHVPVRGTVLGGVPHLAG